MSDQWDSMRRVWPGLVAALICTIAGGLISAVSAHAPSQPASWAAAYLVLVCGMATLGLVMGRGLLSGEAPGGRRLLAEFAAWMLGNALVIIGVLSSNPWIVDAGSIFLVGALALVVRGVLGGGARSNESSASRWMRRIFAFVVLVLLVSIPIGMLLSHLRA